MATSSSEPSFPLHLKVWENAFNELDSLLTTKKYDIESIDPRGRTPLLLAVTLGHLESSKVLLRHGASASATSPKQWTVIHEATATGDPELLQLCLQHRDYQRFQSQTDSLNALLAKLNETPDFFVEMKWEFTSWVPLVSRLCPSDTYKIWKKGTCVRIDTTLVGFENTTWERGSRSFVFKAESAQSAMSLEIDHDAHQVYSTTMHSSAAAQDVNFTRPSADAVAFRLTNAIATTYIDTDKIAFERSRSGFWGWRSDRTEAVNGHQCKVFSASNVELVTKQRTEHLTEEDKKATQKTNKSPMETFLGLAQQQSREQGQMEHSLRFNPSAITVAEYFDPSVDLGSRDIGRPIDQTTKTQKFKASLWLCEEYPLSLQEQVLPIIELMAATNAHFRKLQDFITLQLPAGFPVKIEIPLFHVLNARVTFGNIYGADNATDGVVPNNNPDHPGCTVQTNVFDIPQGYSVIGSYDGNNMSAHSRYRDEDDAILQFAIQQSLMEEGTEGDRVTLLEALNKDNGAEVAQPSARVRQSREDRDLQLALQYSLLGGDIPVVPSVQENEAGTTAVAQDDFEAVLQLSRQQAQEEERKRREQEEEELARILELSLREK